MKTLFDSIISIQPGVTVAIVVLLASRRLMKKHYVAKLRYWLWLVVAIRLCLPFDINIRLGKPAPVNIPVQDYYITADAGENAAITDFEIISADRLAAAQPGETAGQGGRQDADRTVHIQLTDILYTLWAVSVPVLLVLTAAVYMKTRRQILSTAVYDDTISSILEKARADTNDTSSVQAAVCRYNGSPMLMGVLSPVIVIPDRPYTETQLYMVLRHELTHHRRHDIAYKFLLHILRCVYWFNPMVHFMAYYAGMDIEFSCDEDTLRRTGKDFRLRYAQTIMQVITSHHSRIMLATSFAHNGTAVKERFTNIFFGRKLKKGRSLVALFMAVVVMATSMVGCVGTDAVSDEKTDTSPSVFGDPARDYADNYEKIGKARAGGRLVSRYGSYANKDYRVKSFDGEKHYFYYIIDNNTKYGISFIASIDTKGNLEFLCNAENCAHNTEKCRAANLEGHLFTVEKVLYRFDDSNDDGTGRLYQYTGKEWTLKGETTGFNTNGTSREIYFDGDSCIYFKAVNPQTHRRNIVSMNIHNGEIRQEIEETPFPVSLFISQLLCVTENGYIIADGGYADRYGIYAIKGNDIIRISKGMNNTVNYDSSFLDGVLYETDTERNAVTSLRIGEKTKKIAVQFNTDNAGKIEFIRGIYGNKIISTTDKQLHFITDLDTTKTDEFTPIYGIDNGGFNNWVHIFGDIGDYFIIATNYDGPTMAELALISKDDYFAGNPRVYPVVKCRIY